MNIAKNFSNELQPNASPKLQKTLPLGGFSVLSTTSEALIQQLVLALETGEQHTLFFANTNFIVKCQSLQTQMLTNNTLIINDGIGLDIATWLIHRQRFPENLAGTDSIPQYFKSVGSKARVFLFGAKPGIALRAGTTLKEKYDVEIVGTCDGYEQARDSKNLVDEMNAARANVILVAMGNPAQERWILDNRHQLQASVLIGVGAFLDFLAGDKPRAPDLIRKMRLEWLYRLYLEPTRLMRRYTVDIIVFLALCLRAEKRRKSANKIH